MSHPYGHPDSALDSGLASRPYAAIGDGRFVSLAQDPPRLDEGNAVVRLIAGQMGTGKSHCLRRLELAAGASQEVSSPESMPERPGVRVLRRLAPREDPFEIEYWAQVWRIAILASGVSFVREHRSALTTDQQRLIADWSLVSALVAGPEYFQHPYSFFALIEAHSRSDRFTYVEAKEWDDIEQRLPALIARLPTPMVSLDNLDEFFDNDPKILTAFQAGLIRCILALERRHKLLNSMQIRASIRPIAVNLLFRETDKKPAITGSPIVADLYWTSDDLLDLLRRQLDESVPLVDFTSVSVPERGTQEDLFHYLLRHTTGTPRDIVILGNSLLEQRQLTGAPLPEVRFKRLVSETARRLGDSALIHCACDLAAISAADRPARVGGQPSAGTTDAHILVQSLRAWISRRGADVLAMNDLLAATDEWVDDSSRPYLLDEMWRHRLLGVIIDPGGEVSCCRRLDEVLPFDHGDVALSSVLVESCQLKPSPRRLFVAY